MTTLTTAIMSWAIATGETPKTITREIDEVIKEIVRENPHDENYRALAQDWEEMRRKEGITL